MLGKSEMMISHRDLFAAVDLKTRIFTKHPRAAAHARAPAFANGDAGELPASEDGRGSARRRARAGSAPAR